MDPRLTVSDAMTPNPITLRRDEPLEIARALMVSCGIRHLPVEEYGRLLGIVSLCDVINADLQKRGASVTAEDVMTHRVITSEPREKLMHVAERLRESRRSCFPVLDGRRLVGILARADFVPSALDGLRLEAQKRTVAAIMTPGPVPVLHPNDPLEAAYDLGRRYDMRHVPVLDDGRLVGILSDHDFIALSAHLSERRVCDAMKTHVVTVSPDDNAVRAGEQLRRRRFGAMPVMQRGRLVGMLTVCNYFQYWMADPAAGVLLQRAL